MRDDPVRITTRASIILIVVGVLLMVEAYGIGSHQFNFDYHQSGLALVVTGAVLIIMDVMLYLKSRISQKPRAE